MKFTRKKMPTLHQVSFVAEALDDDTSLIEFEGGGELTLYVSSDGTVRFVAERNGISVTGVVKQRPITVTAMIVSPDNCRVIDGEYTFDELNEQRVLCRRATDRRPDREKYPGYLPEDS